MTFLLKDLYSKEFYEKFANILNISIDDFDKELFFQLIFNEGFVHLELKERMKHTARVLHHFLPKDFKKASQSIEKIINNLRKHGLTKYSLEFMFFPEYISMYGLNNLEDAIKAMEFVTQFTSCEFAVRPFILKYEEKMLPQMLLWSNHENNAVRRLASEGSRPRLPWAMAIPNLKKNPKPILPILENLKQDSCEIVRRSVANNLNDIAKDHPDVVIEIAKTWKGISAETNAIIKHGSRTLLKQGNTEILKYFGLSDSEKIVLSDFKIQNPTIKIGDYLNFSFSIENKSTEIQMIRLEYGIYYLRQNGQYNRKVFKISEREFKAFEKMEMSRKQSFKIITTRRFYQGIQKISLIVNGIERALEEFEIIG
jgi:3-methyladenine DNA glycosylase AlkC